MQPTRTDGRLGLPVDFILCDTLIGVALFHHRTLQVALTGLAVITIYKLAFTGFKTGAGLAGLGGHFAHEWVILANLLGLLVGFALLSDHFERSHVPLELPRILPDDWKGGFVLLWIVFVLSGSWTTSRRRYRRHHGGRACSQKVHIGYLAAIVAASNAGGLGASSATPRPR